MFSSYLTGGSPLHLPLLVIQSLKLLHLVLEQFGCLLSLGLFFTHSPFPFWRVLLISLFISADLSHSCSQQSPVSSSLHAFLSLAQTFLPVMHFHPDTCSHTTRPNLYSSWFSTSFGGSANRPSESSLSITLHMSSITHSYWFTY